MDVFKKRFCDNLQTECAGKGVMCGKKSKFDIREESKTKPLFGNICIKVKFLSV
jgi:hypothetical protein